MLLVLLDVLAVSVAALEQAETHQLGIVFSSHQLKVGTHRVVIQQGLVGKDLNDTQTLNYHKTVILQNCDLQYAGFFRHLTSNSRPILPYLLN